MEEFKYNMAQRILIAIGGSAALVGGFEKHFWSDNQMVKKPNKKGTYGASLIAHFAKKNMDKRPTA